MTSHRTVLSTNGAVYSASCTLLLLTYVSLQTVQVCSTGVFELNLHGFYNDLGLNANGHCCSGIREHGSCSLSCRTFFRVCLSHYQAAIEEDPMHCTIGDLTTPVIGENSVNFSRMDMPISNPLQFSIAQFTWPGDFSLIVEAYHDLTGVDPTEGSMRKLISRLAVQRSAAAGPDWYNSRYTTNNSELVYSYRFVCNENYYGTTCDDLCRPRDDVFGHLYCSDNGTKVCLHGWQGEYCTKAVCMVGCHADNGFCNKPDECRCRYGWEGQNCSQCITYPRCQHGMCNKSWECICEDGWGGLLCNQDLNFCTHYAPLCMNGGTCVNSGQGSYRCQCPAGFNGTSCQHRLDLCQHRPCLNGGLCQDTDIGYTCTCPQQYSGIHCQDISFFCHANMCANGGTCVDHDGSYQCLCATGYHGFRCELDAGGCKEDTCQNGGRCVSGLCVCPSGFYGLSCEEDGQDLCTHTSEPCLNGGECIDLLFDYECRCVPGFVGPICELNINDCDNWPCANGARCTDLVNDFACDCQPGWSGKDCSIQVDECQQSPCKHGATCIDRLNTYDCLCHKGFWGRNCQIYVDDGKLSADLPNVKPDHSEPSGGIGAVSNFTDHPIFNGEDGVGLLGGGDGGGGDGGSGQLVQEIGLSVSQLVMIVCVGSGLPIVLIAVMVAIHVRLRRRRLSALDPTREACDNYNNLCRQARTYTAHRQAKCVADFSENGPLNTDAVDRPKDKVNNCVVDGSYAGTGDSIFTTKSFNQLSLSSDACSCSAAVHQSSQQKVPNHWQEDVNRLTANHHLPGLEKASRKHLFKDTLVNDRFPPRHRTLDSRGGAVLDVDCENPLQWLDVAVPHDGLGRLHNTSTCHHNIHHVSIPITVHASSSSGSDIVRHSLFMDYSKCSNSLYSDDCLATEV